jgi:hypothetical protein
MMGPDPLPVPIVTEAFALHDLVEQKKFKPTPPRPPSGFYAASKLGDCIRALYYRYVEHLPEPEDPRFITERAPVGKAWEKIIIDWFRNAGILEEEQVQTEDRELKLRGFIDLTIHDEGVIVPVEIKSIDNGAAFRSRPKSEAYIQLQAYLLMKGVGHGYIVYSETADIGNWWVWRTDRDPAAHRWIRDRLSILEIHRGLGGPPARPVKDPREWKKCSWCPFQKPCWEAKE